MKKIQKFEVSTMIYFMMRSSYIGIGINSLLFFGRESSFLSILIGFLIGIPILLLFFQIQNIDPKKNINELLKDRLKHIYPIFTFLFSLFFFFLSTILFYDLVNFISSEYLYNTPDIWIGFVMILPIFYLLGKDDFTIMRSSIILFFISVFLYLFSMIGLIPSFTLDNLLPMNDFLSILKGGICFALYSFMPIFSFLIFPKQKLESSKKSILLSFLLFTIFIFTSISFVVGVLGIDLALIYQYPDYQVLRRIQIGSFLQRTESILSIQWFLSLFMAITFYLYYVKETIDFHFKKRKYTPLILTMFLFILSLNLFSNNTIFTSFQIVIFPTILSFFFLFLLLCFFVIKKRK